jgi:uncharacterized protein (TIRG00374 family)
MHSRESEGQERRASGTTSVSIDSRSAAKPRRAGGGLSSLLKLLVSLALLAWILNRVGWRETVRTLSTAHIPYLLAALALYLVSIVGRAFRWRLLVDALGMHLSLVRLTHLYFVGGFFSTFLPTEVGGDVVRVYEVMQESDSPAAAVGTVLLDRATGLLALFLLALCALAFSYSLVGGQIAAAIVLLTVSSWGGALLLMQRSLLERLGLLRLVRRLGSVEEVYESIHACGLKAIAEALAVSLVLNALLIAMNYLVARALGVTISLWYFVLFVPIISAVLMLPVSMSGVGVREGAYVYLFSQAGVTTAQALTMSLLIYSVRLVAGLVGGFLYALQGFRELRVQRPD